MLHANPKTRRQNSTAGESVDVEGYMRKMADNATDGDHLTLQVRLVCSPLCVCNGKGGPTGRGWLLLLRTCHPPALTPRSLLIHSMWLNRRCATRCSVPCTWCSWWTPRSPTGSVYVCVYMCTCRAHTCERKDRGAPGPGSIAGPEEVDDATLTVLCPSLPFPPFYFSRCWRTSGSGRWW